MASKSYRYNFKTGNLEPLGYGYEFSYEIAPGIMEYINAVKKTLNVLSMLDRTNPEQKAIYDTLAPETAKVIDAILKSPKIRQVKKVIWDKDKINHDPAAKAKLEFYKKLTRIVEKHFDNQIPIIRGKLEAWKPERKSTDLSDEQRTIGLLNAHVSLLRSKYTKATIDIPWLLDADLWSDDEFDADMMLTLLHAAENGIDLFEAAVAIGIDYSLVNSAAATWARKHTFELVKGINDTTRTALQKAVSAFVETPGMTIGDAMKLMPFGTDRAQTVAVTEITRAYSSANRLAGEQLAKEFPDMQVVKQWFTNQDDRVCEICGPLNGKTVGLNEDFSPGISEPPGHVNCRCWDSVTTELRNE